MDAIVGADGMIPSNCRVASNVSGLPRHYSTKAVLKGWFHSVVIAFNSIDLSRQALSGLVLQVLRPKTVGFCVFGHPLLGNTEEVFEGSL